MKPKDAQLKSRKELQSATSKTATNEAMYNRALFVINVAEKDNQVLPLLENTVIANLIMKETKGNFSEENILFLQAYRNYLTHPSESSYQKIVDKFIRQNADIQINIDSQTRKNCVTALKNYDVSDSKKALADAAGAIQGLLLSNAKPNELLYRDTGKFVNLNKKITELKNKEMKQPKQTPMNFFNNMKNRAKEQLQKLSKSEDRLKLKK